MQKPSLKKKNCSTIESLAGRDKEVYTVPKDICPKVEAVARLEFELGYDIVQHFGHYAIGTSLAEFSICYHISLFWKYRKRY